MTSIRTEDGRVIKGFDEVYANALVDGINEEAEGELWVIGYLLSDYMRVISLYIPSDPDHVIKYDVRFNAGSNIDQYIEQVINDIRKNHNTIIYERTEHAGE